MSTTAQIVREYYDSTTGHRYARDIYLLDVSGGYSPDVARDLVRAVTDMAAADHPSDLDEHFREIADCLDEGDES